MASKLDWFWNKRLPTNQAEFEAMMIELDGFLASQGKLPAQRPFEAARQLSMRLGYSGKPLLPLERIEIKQPFDAGWCIKAAWLWFEAIYGDKLAIDFGPGSVVLDLRGSLWRFQMPRIYGEVGLFIDTNLSNKGVSLSKPGEPPASINVLCQVDGITQPLADRLTFEETKHIFSVFQDGYLALTKLEGITGDDFFEQARAEYRHSVEALLASDWAKARYDTALCAEKVFKGILRKNGKGYPTDAKKGHDIPLLGELLHTALDITLPKPLLESVHCPTKVRYGEMLSTGADGLGAHRALLAVLVMLRGIK
jgi:hypothetical protein